MNTASGQVSQFYVSVASSHGELQTWADAHALQFVQTTATTENRSATGQFQDLVGTAGPHTNVLACRIH